MVQIPVSGGTQSQDAPFTRRSFDALVAGLGPHGSAWAELRAAGFDPAEPREGWPVEVFHASVQVLRRHRFGALPEAEGLRRTGHLWVEGYLATPVGQVIAAGLRGTTPEQALRRLVQHVKTARHDAAIQLEGVTERSWRLRLMQAEVLPDFNQGVFEAVLSGAVTGTAGVEVQVESTLPPFTTLLVRW